jgi:hydrogenase maturation protease
MNTNLVDAIANAVLYEGYMLYPYRASSVKNRQRFNFGVLYPPSYSEAQAGTDPWNMQTECLVRGSAVTTVEVKVRFLKLIARSVGKPAESTPQSGEREGFQVVPSLEVEGQVFQPWQEAIEHEVVVPSSNLESLSSMPLEWKFASPAEGKIELLQNANGQVVGLVARKQESVCGVVEINAQCIDDGLFKVTVRVKNLTSWEPDAHTKGSPAGRDEALMRSLVSAHTILGAVDGEFVSSFEPPDDLREVVASCQNVGTWPVLVGEAGKRDTMLSSPIILYDYPQIAPESPGDLFDGTEIDEILALRIMTMTDAEKREMRGTDERSRRILDRTEALPMERLRALHGTLRELRPLREETP